MLTLFALACSEPLPVALVPQPVSVEVGTGSFDLAGERITSGDPEVGELLAAQLGLQTGERGRIELSFEDGHDDEGYALSVGRRGVRIRATTPAGLFYGGQTLRQLAWDGAAPVVEIEDAPRFAWRGSMIDVARHFFTVEDLESHIDLMALHKLNRLHLHLTDDQGWRLEILSWPQLAAVGGSTQVGGGAGGFYTQDQYRQLVDYAAQRFVTVVPEVDMPGHCNAALASYGELSPNGKPTEPYTGTSVGFSSFCLDCEATRPFLLDVLGEVVGLTPGEWLHVGGDEADATDPADYAAFMGWVQGVVADLGRTMVAWDEVAEADLGPPLVGQWWHSETHATTLAAQGGQLIASPVDHAYLDMMYDAESPVGQFYAGFTSVQDAYEWSPVPAGVGEEDVLGVEAPLWSETTQTWGQVEYLVWPRLAGHAEIAWSRPGTWADYEPRLAVHLERLAALGVEYGP